MPESPIDRSLTTLNSAGISQKMPAIYQVIKNIIDVIRSIQESIVSNATNVASQVNTILTDATFLTGSDETATYLSSRQLLAGSGISFDDTVAGQRTVNSILRSSTITLTDAQIKALPSTPISILAAPGVGFRNRILGLSLIADIITPYTNIDPVYADAQFSGGTFLNGPIDDPATVPPLAQFTALFGTAGKRIYDLISPYAETHGTGIAYVQSLCEDDSYINNTPTTIFMTNGAGDLTGGNAGNTLKITIYYCIEEL